MSDKCEYWIDECAKLQVKVEELEAEVRILGNAHHNEIETRTKNYELQSRIEAVEGLVNVLNNRANHESDLAPLYASIVEQLREALGGSDE